MATSSEIIEHGSSRPGRWLGTQRLKIALWIAVVEGLLVVFHVIPWWLAAAAAAVFVVFYFSIGHRLPTYSLRQVAWIAATSQALVALVPILVAVVGTLALVAVGFLAVIALIALFVDPR